MRMARLIPDSLPHGLHAGFVHYHTCFGYPSMYRIEAEEMVAEISSVGGEYLFCAGDHESEYGPGWYGGEDYYRFVLSVNEKQNEVICIPTGEYHLWFPGLESRDPNSAFQEFKRKHPDYMPFHHLLIPADA